VEKNLLTLVGGMRGDEGKKSSDCVSSALRSGESEYATGVLSAGTHAKKGIRKWEDSGFAK